MNISYIDIEGRRIAAEVHGSGPLVVCSPAMGDTREAYRPLAERLVEHGFRVALLDLRGHGDSDTGFARYGDEATADDLLAAIDALGDGPAYLAGASMSAAAAVIAAGRRPEAVSGLILLGPFLRNGAGAAVRMGMRLLLARPWGPAAWRSYAARLWPGLGEQARTRAAMTTRAMTGKHRWSAFAATARTDHAVVAPWIGKVTAPSLVVMGASDPDWKDPRAEAEWVTGQLGSEVLMVPDVGHAPMLEAPDAVAPRIVEFVKGAADAPRAGLDPEAVVRRASALIDECGVEALTLARLAGELGVAAPSLYKHIGGLDDLIDRVASAATAELGARLGAATRGRSGRDALAALAEAYRRFAREHPGTYPLTQRHRDSEEWTAAATDTLDSVVAALSGYGVTAQDTDGIRYVRAALHGFVDLERGGGFGLSRRADESITFLVDALDTTLRRI